MQDFKEKANFMSDLSLRQERMRNMYDPSKMNQPQQQAAPPPVNNQAMKPPVDPNAMSGFQKGELGIRQQQADQANKFGQESQDTKSAQEKLNQQKSDQIHEQKINELQQKTSAANEKLKVAQQGLADKTKSAAEQLQFHKDAMKAANDAHAAEKERLQLNFDKTSGQHQETIDNLTEQLRQKGSSTTTQSKDPITGAITTQTNRGSAAKTVQVPGKNGKTYEIPADKVDEWNTQHAPEGQAPPPALAVDSGDDEDQ